MRYVIIGGGPAGVFAAEAIRRRDFASPILLVTEEGEVARSPVMLTHWIGGEVSREAIRFRDPSWDKMNRVDLRLCRKAVAVETSSQKLILEKGETIPYDRLLIATGSSPISLPIPGARLKGVQAIRQVSDGEAILGAIPTLRQAIIIGGGFIGLKIAGHLKERGIEVSILEKENRLAPRMFDAQASLFLVDLLGRKGVRVETGVGVEEILGKADRVCAVRVRDGRILPAQTVIQSVGVKPNTAFLTGSGIVLEMGIPVNPFMETNIPGVYAAGDVAVTSDSITGEKINNATWPAASRQGTVAGMNMAGGRVSSVHNLPLNAFQLAGIPVMAAGNSGETDGEVFREEGADFYRKVLLRDGRVTGFILIGKVSQAGVLLASMKKKEILSKADLTQESSLRLKQLPPGLGYRHGLLFPEPKI
ncbi:MAG TPA: FAD-dependent oxidoreductase [Thermodesulfobacteriota bacterium]|nr:FAD-dependent oxidoreductase [Thermodesulfobacteriota bacterium]